MQLFIIFLTYSPKNDQKLIAYVKKKFVICNNIYCLRLVIFRNKP